MVNNDFVWSAIPRIVKVVMKQSTTAFVMLVMVRDWLHHISWWLSSWLDVPRKVVAWWLVVLVTAVNYETSWNFTNLLVKSLGFALEAPLHGSGGSSPWVASAGTPHLGASQEAEGTVERHQLHEHLHLGRCCGRSRWEVTHFGTHRKMTLWYLEISRVNSA